MIYDCLAPFRHFVQCIDFVEKWLIVFGFITSHRTLDYCFMEIQFYFITCVRFLAVVPENHFEENRDNVKFRRLYYYSAI